LRHRAGDSHVPSFFAQQISNKKPEKRAPRNAKTAFRHGVGKLFVNGVAVRGISSGCTYLWADGICREHGNDNQNDREEFTITPQPETTVINCSAQPYRELQGKFAKLRAGPLMKRLQIIQ
jgi:hypothetical protein